MNTESEMLKDNFSRVHNYLRISVTDKCNLRCSYCIPPEGVEFLSHDEVMRNEEFIRLIKIFVSMGINKIRFTGGEPLLKKGFPEMLTETRKLFPKLEMCLTTNGVFLWKHIDLLIKLNVKKLNISLDTVSRERYEAITGIDAFDDVHANIDIAERTGYFDLKINCVLFNETIDEIDRYLDVFKERKLMLRFIERMPFTTAGDERFVPSEELIDALRDRGSLIRDARSDTQVARMFDFSFKGIYPMKIGMISPISDKFCTACNRLRLSSDGNLKACLLGGGTVDLKSAVRNGSGDDEIIDLIRSSVNLKGREHEMEGCTENGGCASIKIKSPMSKIGG